MRPEQKLLIDKENREAQDKDREALRKRRERKLVSYHDALARRFRVDWARTPLAKPAFLGTRALNDIHLGDLVPYIDWSPFFMAWEVRGEKFSKYPAIFEDPRAGKEARDLFEKAGALLKRLIREHTLTARGVYGFFPANADGDDIVIYRDESRTHEQCRFPMLRQQWEREGQASFLSLADFIAPVGSGVADYLGAFAVSAGFGTQELAAQFRAQHDDYNAIMVEALADRLAEAFAEYLHERARRDWGFGQGEKLSKDDLLEEKYRGIRPAAGYPSSPDHSEKRTLWTLLDAEAQTGIRLTENFAMWPGASVSGMYFAHPEARYFAVDMITRDQVEDYARRKGMPFAEVERWLSSNLAYDVS